jgi:putative transposase
LQKSERISSKKSKTHYLTESYFVASSDSRWQELDRMAWLSKNIYNAANYLLRHAFFKDRKAGIERKLGERYWTRYLNYAFLYREVRKNYPQDYYALPKRVANETIKLLLQDWTSYDEAHTDWEQHPYKYYSEPRIPHYKKRAEAGRCETTWEKTAIHKGVYHKNGLISLSGCNVLLETGEHIYERIRQIEGLADNISVNLYEYLVEIRLVPRVNDYELELIYGVTPKESLILEQNFVAGIDLGVNNLMTITSNKVGFQPLIVNGRPLKSLNQFFNKRCSHLKSQLPEGQFSSKAIKHLQQIRNRRIKDYLHTVSKLVIENSVKQGIGVLVIGRNLKWKQQVKMGKANNQTFVNIPFRQLINMLIYKAKLVGIKVILVEENYTSKCSFLDGETPKKHEIYAGKRVKRGLFCSGNGRLINADVNASYNIIKKAFPNAFAEGIEDAAVHPVLLIPARKS